MNVIKHNLNLQRIASGFKNAEVERLSELSHSTIARMFDENDPSIPDLISLIIVLKIIGGSFDKICGLVSDDVPMDASAQIADNAISAYSELLATKDKQIAEKDKLIDSLYGQLERYGRVIDTLTRQLDKQ